MYFQEAIKDRDSVNRVLKKIDKKAMMDGMRTGRKSTMVTLGKLIAALEKLPGLSDVQNIGNPHSYRGYYEDIAFSLIEADGTRSAESLLAECRECIGKTFEGYKGGDYTMREDTPVWIAAYGCCGVPLVKVTESGEFITGDYE